MAAKAESTMLCCILMNSIWISGWGYTSLPVSKNNFIIYFEFLFIWYLMLHQFSCIWSCDYRRLYLCASFGIAPIWSRWPWVHTIALTFPPTSFITVSSGIAPIFIRSIECILSISTSSCIWTLSSCSPCQEQWFVIYSDARHVLPISLYHRLLLFQFLSIYSLHKYY